MSNNVDLQMTLDEAVAEVLMILTGLDLEYDPGQDRYQAITRFLNRAMRSCALEHEWSWYTSTEEVGTAMSGVRDVELSSRLRMRIVNDDAVRLVDADDHPRVWAYILPQDALHKYMGKPGLWASVTRSTITFSRRFYPSEEGLRIVVPVMREPRMFDIPPTGEPIAERVRNQRIDFDYPDLVIARAAYLYSQADPVMQPRAQTLEDQYKDIMYQLIERDTRHTDSPYVNDFVLPITGALNEHAWHKLGHAHPHSMNDGF